MGCARVARLHLSNKSFVLQDIQSIRQRVCTVSFGYADNASIIYVVSLRQGIVVLLKPLLSQPCRTFPL